MKKLFIELPAFIEYDDMLEALYAAKISGKTHVIWIDPYQEEREQEIMEAIHEVQALIVKISTHEVIHKDLALRMN